MAIRPCLFSTNGCKRLARRVTREAEAYQKRYQDALAAYYKGVAKTHAATQKKLEAGEPTKENIKPEGKDPFFNAVFGQKGPLMIPAKEREKFCSDDVKQQVKELQAKAEEMKKAGPPEPDMADAVSEDKPVQQKVLLRGDYNSPGDDAPRGVLTILTKAEPAAGCFQRQRTAGNCGVDEQSEKSHDGARNGEPAVDVAFWRRHCRYTR